MPRWEIVETQKGYYVVDADMFKGRSSDYEGLTLYKWKAGAEAALRALHGDFSYDPKHRVYQLNYEPGQEEWGIHKHTRDGRNVTVPKKFKSEAEAQKYIEADLKKIEKETEKLKKAVTA